MDNDEQAHLPEPSMLEGPSAKQEHPAPIIDEKLWCSLRWPLFGPIAEIMVMEDAGDPQSPQNPLFGQSEPHPLAIKVATVPSRSRMLTSCWLVDAYEADTENPIPDPLVIQNAEDYPITVGDIVIALHPYLNNMEGVIREVYNSKAQFYFNGFSGRTKAEAYNPELLFPNRLKEDEGDMEYHWETEARIVRAQREHWPPKVDRPELISPMAIFFGHHTAPGFAS